MPNTHLCAVNGQRPSSLDRVHPISSPFPPTHGGLGLRSATQYRVERHERREYCSKAVRRPSCYLGESSHKERGKIGMGGLNVTGSRRRLRRDECQFNRQYNTIFRDLHPKIVSSPTSSVPMTFHIETSTTWDQNDGLRNHPLLLCHRLHLVKA